MYLLYLLVPHPTISPLLACFHHLVSRLCSPIHSFPSVHSYPFSFLPRSFSFLSRSLAGPVSLILHSLSLYAHNSAAAKSAFFLFLLSLTHQPALPRSVSLISCALPTSFVRPFFPCFLFSTLRFFRSPFSSITLFSPIDCHFSSSFLRLEFSLPCFFFTFHNSSAIFAPK